MNSLLLALILILPAGTAGARGKDILFEVKSTGNLAVDRELAVRGAEVLRRRLEGLKLQASVEKRGDRTIAVVPSFWTNLSDERLQPLLQAGSLEFRLVDDSGRKPRPGQEVLYESRLDPASRRIERIAHVVDKRALMGGERLRSARVELQEVGGERVPAVGLEFDEEGARQLEKATVRALRRRMATVLDGNVVSAAVVQEPISGGRMRVSGSFSMQEAEDLAQTLNSGPLPPELRRVGVPAPAPAVPVLAQAAPAAAQPAPRSEVDDLPAALGRQRPDAYAVVIGIERYRQRLPRADFAARDAQSVADYLVKVLGWRAENVVLLQDEHAAKSDLEKYLQDWLPSKARAGSSVFVYYSGHGSPDPAKGDAFLVPYDGDPTFLPRTGYALKRLYADLGRLPAKSVLVAVDACFSGAGSRSILAKGARPLVTRVDAPEKSASLSVMTASAGNQISSTYESQGHGLFTFHLLKAVKEAAAQGRAAAWGDVFETLRPRVEVDARRLSHSEQTPQLSGLPALLGESL